MVVWIPLAEQSAACEHGGFPGPSPDLQNQELFSNLVIPVHTNRDRHSTHHISSVIHAALGFPLSGSSLRGSKGDLLC
jgi:hypothetical protein